MKEREREKGKKDGKKEEEMMMMKIWEQAALASHPQTTAQRITINRIVSIDKKKKH